MNTAIGGNGIAHQSMHLRDACLFSGQKHGWALIKLLE
jgi:hypothetical protein